MIAGHDTKSRADDLYRRIAESVRGPTALMEVCGTHTMTASRSGLRHRLPDGLRLLSGPGCPVCVTPTETIDELLAMAAEPGVTIATFGDMMRVPGSRSSLAKERANGRDVKVVYSPFDALKLAREKPERLVVFMGVGFETTAPAVAATLLRAADQGVGNFLVLSAFKLVPPAMLALVADGAIEIDGFICPGHVSAVIGAAPYEPLAAEKRIPCVIAGFEPVDMLEGILMLLEQIETGRAEVEIQYKRAVPPAGNPEAIEVMHRVLRRCDARWRGIGLIPDSGLDIAEAFCDHDARRRIRVEVMEQADMPEGCSCGEILKGSMMPNECALFGRACTPANPVGPCMVSSEGACAAHYHYGMKR